MIRLEMRDKNIASANLSWLIGRKPASLVLRSLLSLWLFTCCLHRGGAVDFNRDILPLLSDNCFQCHGPDERARKAKLRLDIPEDAFRIREGTAAIVPKQSQASELVRRISSTDPDEVMPPPETKRSLTPNQIELFRRWIDEGASWGEHWAFQKLTQPPVPALTRFEHRVVNSIDRFVFARLEKEGLSPSPEAPRETLIRRLTLDLTGLGPAPDDVDQYLNDTEPGAYARSVERLLNSPAYGERMAWDWLDAARYADSNGYQGDADRTMWLWRDWVIDAFNRNLPYDEFTRWQLAGDLLSNSSREQKLATGFARNHMINGEGGRIPEENRVDYVMDMAETTGTVWLGLTLNCCRCHDHKFDPLSQRDYYSFYAFFNQTPVTGAGGDPQTPPHLEFPTPEQSKRLADLQASVAAAAQSLGDYERASAPKQVINEAGETVDLPDKVRDLLKVDPSKRNRNQLLDLEKAFEKGAPEYIERLKQFRQEIEKRDAVQRSIVRVMVLEDMPQPRKTFMLDKGIYEKPLDEVSAAVPAKFNPGGIVTATNRLGLAEWLVAPENPLTARVTVNRLWQQFFGRGLVKTPEDFGVQGDRPSHPELLDWLAGEFIRSGWDVKGLCRLIVQSATYRQSSKTTAELTERDPENRLLARGPRFRLPSWMIRDQALAASGLLVSKIGGAPVRPYQPSGVWEEATFGNRKYTTDAGANLYRRSLYTFWRRIVAPTMFFDSASRQTCSVTPRRTNTPLHALATMNDVTYVEAARGLAYRAMRAGGDSELSQIDWAFRFALGRAPTQPEQEHLHASYRRLQQEFADQPDQTREFLETGQSRPHAIDDHDRAKLAALAGVCLVILNLDEALTKE